MCIRDSYKEQMKGLEQKRAEAEKKTEGIDPELLAKYRAIKQHCARPIAKLYGCLLYTSSPQAGTWLCFSYI